MMLQLTSFYMMATLVFNELNQGYPLRYLQFKHWQKKVTQQIMKETAKWFFVSAMAGNSFNVSFLDTVKKHL